MNSKNEYNRQEKELFNFYLNMNMLPLPDGNNSRYKDLFVNDNDRSKNFFTHPRGIELIIRPDCNQKCEYCYITQHGKELYPNRISKEDTLKNVNLILDFIFHQRKNFLYEYALFAGDLFFDDLFFDILDLFDKYFSEIKEDYPKVFDKRIQINVPCNLNWVYENPEKVEKFDKYFSLFTNQYNTYICISWSTDGLYGIKSREKKELNQEYFDVIFKFCKKYGYGFHPMIAPENIDTWCENYDWWMEMYEKHDLTYPGGLFQPYMLEVRNNNWTEEKIAYHNTFLDHVMEWRYKLNGYNKEKLARALLIGDGENDSTFKPKGCDPIDLVSPIEDSRFENLSCSAQDLIHFNCNNLSICFCHRVTYPQFVPIYFITNKEKTHIIDYKVQNVGAYLTLQTMRRNNFPVCSQCKYKTICKQGCLGSQFEDSGEIMMPIPSLCHFFKTKYDYLVDLYHKYDIIKIGYENNYLDKNKHEFLIEKAYEKGYLI